MAENLDTALYDTKEEALEAALSDSLPGERLVVCRGDWAKCPQSEICDMCARVTVVDGMTAGDVLAQAKAGHA